MRGGHKAGSGIIFSSVILAHLAGCEVAILRRAAADMAWAIGMTFCWPLTLADLARAAADMVRRIPVDNADLGLG